MKTNFQAFTLLIFGLLASSAYSQVSMQAGLQARSEWNAFQTSQSDENTTRHLNAKPDFAFGFNFSQYFNPKFFIECGFNLNKARYTVNQAQGTSVFQRANIRFLQTNANLGYHLFGAAKVSPYVFAGLQFLHRRWGEEYYLGAQIPDSRWPNQRLCLQSGLGVAFSVSDALRMRCFAGLRHNLSQTLIYDTPMNQVFSGVSLLATWTSKAKPNYVKCPKF